MVPYRERLWAAPWLFIATALVIPASMLVLLPISILAGIITALVLYAGCVFLLVLGSPRIEVTDERLIAGHASIDRNLIGTAVAFDGPDASLERGQRLDARAWLLIRGWVKPVVRVPIIDPVDPTPYWLLSTRRPTELLNALNGIQDHDRPQS